MNRDYVQKCILVSASFLVGIVLIELSLQVYGLFLDHRRSKLEPELEGRIRILTLGESTTDALVAPGRRAWPEYLEEALNSGAQPRKFAVINKGRAGTSTTFLRKELPDHLERYRPHLVIMMTGLNDSNHLDFLHRNDFWSNLRLVRLFKTLFSARPPVQPSAEDVHAVHGFISAIQTTSGEVPEKFRHWMKEHPGSEWYAWHRLGNHYFHMARKNVFERKEVDFSAAFQAAKKCLELNPYHEETITQLLQSSHQHKEEARAIVKQLLRKGYHPSAALIPWLHFVQYSEDPELVTMLKEKGLTEHKKRPSEITRDNYQEIIRRSFASGAAVAVMAYPTTHLSGFRLLLNSKKELEENTFRFLLYKDDVDQDIDPEFSKVMFIENLNFPTVPDKEHYVDFARVSEKKGFGHLNRKGHQEVAKNVVKVLSGKWLPEIQAGPSR